jgi:hypothetical protein
MGSFAERTLALEEKVGRGELRGTVSFGPDEIAVPQHEGTWASGPNAGIRIRNYSTPGTGPKYLEAPLLANHPAYLGQIAAVLLELGPQRPMGHAMDNLSDVAKARIPKEFGDLMSSAASRVRDNGSLIHERLG